MGVLGAWAISDERGTPVGGVHNLFEAAHILLVRHPERFSHPIEHLHHAPTYVLIVYGLTLYAYKFVTHVCEIVIDGCKIVTYMDTNDAHATS